MSNFKLNLPTDIPWRRKCVSEDMVVPHFHFGHGELPPRWRSSIAIFEYEPDADNQNYDGMVISYLKVVCTITGYQVNPSEIGVHPRGPFSYWRDQPGIVDYVNKLQEYYACFGAVLEVTVAPEGTEPDVADFPFFMDFEPKKRELYQQATETNERQSRSIESLNLTKSAGSTQSLEVYDIDMGGGGLGMQSTYAGTGGGFNYSAPNGQHGTKRMNAEESLASRSSDVGEEKRDTYSFATQLSQLYHQLDSYHVGTNRAVFFVLPRPHTLETEHTFVNGIRNIEGIQEFFLVVARPKAVAGVCVEAYLETGHIGKTPYTALEEIAGSEVHESWTATYSAAPRGGDDETPNVDNADREWKVADQKPGYKIKSAVLGQGPFHEDYKTQGGWEPNLVDAWPHITSAPNPDFVTVSGSVHSFFRHHNVGKNESASVAVSFTVDITLVKTQEVAKSLDTLFMTARHLNCCTPTETGLAPGDRLATGIVYEKEMSDAAPPSEGATAVERANAVQNAIHAAIKNSASDWEHRYDQPVSLSHTDFAARTLASYVPDASDTEVRQLPNISDGLRRKLGGLNADVRAGDLLPMSLKKLQGVFALTMVEAIELRGALTGTSQPVADSREAWLTTADMERLFGRSNPPTDEEPTRQRDESDELENDERS